MPSNLVKTKADEEKWNQAKKLAKDEGQENNWAYINSIYQKRIEERKMNHIQQFKAVPYSRVFGTNLKEAVDIEKIKAAIFKVAKVFGVPSQWIQDTADLIFRIISISKDSKARIPLKLRELIEKTYQETSVKAESKKRIKEDLYGNDYNDYSTAIPAAQSYSALDIPVEVDESSNTSDSSFLGEFLRILAQMRVYHWQTSAYAQHQAFGSYYDAMSDLIDSFVESYQGKYERVKFASSNFVASVNLEDYDPSTCCQYIDEILSFLEGLQSTTQDSELDNIIDEMKQETTKLKYLLTLN